MTTYSSATDYRLASTPILNNASRAICLRKPSGTLLSGNGANP